MFIKRITPILLAAAVAVLALAPGSAAAKGRDGFHATVLSVSPSGDSVRVSRSSGRKVRVAITPSTKFERISGVGGLTRGLAIEIKATRTSSGLVARQIEISGGDDDRGDDNGGRGGESEPGDDHGSGGHGSDDR